MRLRRRITELEERVAALEAVSPPIDYTMPPRYDIDMTPPKAVLEYQPYGGPEVPEDEQPEDTRTGVYL